MSAPEPESEIVEGEAAPPRAAPRIGKRLVVIAGCLAVLLLVGSGVAFAISRFGAGKGAPVAEHHADVDVTYVDSPAMVINLRGADGAARFLKIRFTIVPASPAAGEKIEAKLPLIIDAFQPFLRELRPEDLAGSAAVFRIKEEMLIRATTAIGPDVVKDILIQDLIQQ